MTGDGVSPETTATLLLCGGFAPTRRDEPAEPLNVSEFNRVLAMLANQGRTLADGLNTEVIDDLIHEPAMPGKIADRLPLLMQRTTALEMAVQRWSSMGFWVLDRTDSRYPERFREHLGESAPPLLYGTGDWELLNRDLQRVAVVGSRDIDDDAETFARNVGGQAAANGMITVSGGARGADRSAIDAALEAGGLAIAILPGALEQVATSRAYRSAIADGWMLAVSPYHPRAKFTAGNAMGRNRLIYCLSDVGIVVESAEGSGGTWSGATETLENDWVPVGVRAGEAMSAGNRALIDGGGLPIEPSDLSDPDRFASWFARTTESHSPTPAGSDSQQLGLFDR